MSKLTQEQLDSIIQIYDIYLSQILFVVGRGFAWRTLFIFKNRNTRNQKSVIEKPFPFNNFLFLNILFLSSTLQT